MADIKQIRVRRDTSAAFAAAGVRLADGEPAYLTDTSQWVIGDGVALVADLPRLSKGDRGPQGLPGVNGLANDAATAAQIDSSSSATRAALIRAAVTYDGTSDIKVIKPDTDTRPGVWEWVHSSPAGYLLHLMTGVGASSASALIGMGIDNGGIGLFLNNKKTGVGIALQQNDTITSATAYGVYGNQMSKTAPLFHIDQADGAKHVLRVVASESSVETNELLEIITTGVSGGGYVSSRSGAIYWRSDINATQGKRVRAVQNIAADGNSSAIEPDAVRLSTWNGGDGGYWQKRIGQNGQSLLLQMADGTSGGRDAVPPQWFTGVEVKQVNGTSAGTQLGFYGAAPTARPTVPAVAADAGTTQTLVNALRVALINLGLVSS